MHTFPRPIVREYAMHVDDPRLRARAAGAIDDYERRITALEARVKRLEEGEIGEPAPSGTVEAPSAASQQRAARAPSRTAPRVVIPPGGCSNATFWAMHNAKGAA